MDYSSTQIGARIHQQREKSDISQAQLADYLGIDQSMISKIESGERRTSIETIEKLSVLFGCSFDSEEECKASETTLKFAFRAGSVRTEDLETIAAVGRVALNLREMRGLLRGDTN